MDRYSRYEDAMVVQQQLLRWSMSTDGKNYLRAYFRSAGKLRGYESEQEDALVGLHVAGLQQAEPIYVSVEACELVDYAMQTFEPEAVLPGDAFTPNGFALLARPLMLLDSAWEPESPGRSPTGFMPVRAISWQSIHNEDLSSGVFDVCYYVDTLDEAILMDEARLTADEDELQRIDVWDRATEHMRQAGQTLSIAHQFHWRWGESPWDDDDQIKEWSDTTGESIDDVLSLAKAQVVMVQAFWRLASQFRPLPERAPRGIWRDYTRRVRPQKDVTVIRLRRGREGEQAEPAGRGLSVQFPVRGHWRNQWFPSIEAHRQVWISPYVKGPEGAPFVCKPRAWEFTR